MEHREWMDLLIPEAREASKNAYIPYSGFWVGAALLAKSGRIYRGCNIENGAFGPTNCAERTAFFTAIAQGEREFSAIAIVGGFAAGRPAAGAGFAYPCGVCRQVMAEFCRPGEFWILLENHLGERRCHTLEELLPHGFSLED